MTEQLTGRPHAAFAGKVALVTGAASGIGRQVAQDLVSRGVRVGLVGRTAETLEQTARELGGETTWAVGDVRDSASLEAAVTSVRQALGPIELGVQCAASGVGQRFLVEQQESDWLMTIDTNLNGSYRFCRALVPDLVQRGRGAIVLMSSVAGLRGVPANTAYCASKHGIHGLVKALATEVGYRGVRVNAVCPGLTDTEMVRDEGRYGRDFMDSVRRHRGPDDLTWERYWRSTVRATDMGRLIQPEEVSRATLFLLEDGAGAITGQTLSVDGGMP